MTLFCTKCAVALLRLQGRKDKKKSIQKQKWKGERLKGDNKKGERLKGDNKKGQKEKNTEIEQETRNIEGR